MNNIISKLSLNQIDGYEFQSLLSGGGSALSAIYKKDSEKLVFKFLICPRNNAEKFQFEREFQSLYDNATHKITEYAEEDKFFFGPKTSYPLPEVIHNLTKIYNEDVLYFSYRFIVGELLSDIDVESLAQTEKYKLLHRVASGLNYFSQCGFSHRDLHPKNILLCPDHFMDPEGDFNDPRVKILDMGSCVESNSPRFSCFINNNKIPDLESGRRLISSFDSMPPDFIIKGKAIKNYDTWAFGVLSFKILFGRLPYDLEDLSDVYKLHKGTLELNKDHTKCFKQLPYGIRLFLESFLQPKGEHRPELETVVRLLHWIIYDGDKLENENFAEKILQHSGFDPNHDPLDDIY